MRWWIIVGVMALMASCAAQFNRKECVYSVPVTTQQSYCAQQASQTCSSYCDAYGCRQNCSGGGYCVQTGYRTVTVNECQQYACKAGYIAASGGCFTQAELDARKARSRDGALDRARKANDNGQQLAVIAYKFETGREGYPGDTAKAFALYDEACDLGSGYGCNRMGMVTRDGALAPQDFDAALAYFQRGCTAGSGQACHNAGWQYESAAHNGPDDQKAFSYYASACALEYTWSCGLTASWTFFGRGVAADREAGRALLEDAVAQNAQDLKDDPDDAWNQRVKGLLEAERANLYRAGAPDAFTPYATGDYEGAVRAGRQRVAFIAEGVRKGVLPRQDLAVIHGSLSWYALLNGDFALAEQSARKAAEIAPDLLFVQGNLAHVLMYQGRVNEAEAIYLRHAGDALSDGRDWVAVVLEDFDLLTKAGFDHPHMDVVRRKLTP